MKTASYYNVGLDVGSTTAKFVLLDSADEIVFSEYVRHNTHIAETVISIINKLNGVLKDDVALSLKLTGSAGMGISEKTEVAFVQEVIAISEIVQAMYPKVHTLIDMGGEDSKMIFFSPNRPPDIRMNGSCAGGTGAFIDQMANLLNIPVAGFGELAKNYTQTYPIASRCGVFAKTDVQNLISRNVPKQDIAQSILYAVCIQLVNTLSRGYDIQPKVMLVGGPFSFIPALSDTFQQVLKIDDNDLVRSKRPTLLSAIGAAIQKDGRTEITISEFIKRLQSSTIANKSKSTRLTPLFNEKLTYDNWMAKRNYMVIPRLPLTKYRGQNAFLGIDSGSTTTKIVLLSENDELLFTHYAPNNANPVKAVVDGLKQLYAEVKNNKPDINIVRTAVTGYGEELMKAAFSLDDGMVETMAHFVAAKHIQPKVSFIMDIGGQDMKAIFVCNGIVNHIELNEACSSGCGSFIQTFGKSLGYSVSEFTQKACNSKNPCDLGTRCTVFMNSKVKQALRENATVDDISAGIAISVIKNALYKVLKINNIEKLGKHIVVQGGTFKNPAVFRALEELSGATITSSDIPELMGAFGAALIAKGHYLQTPSTSKFIGFDHLNQSENSQTKQATCKGCENSCTISSYNFGNGNRYFSGNKCERFISNSAQKTAEGFNMFEFKNDLLFNRISIPKDNNLTLGIPRVLDMYENYPFWHTLFTQCGIHVELSPQSTMGLYEKGAGTVMSDSICFPAKLVHGHIVELANAEVDRIFMPLVMFESSEFEDAINSYNCPIVSSYSEVMRSAVNPSAKYSTPFDTPVINFSDEKLLRKACRAYCKSLGISQSVFSKAFKKAIVEQVNYKKALQDKAKEVLQKAKADDRYVFVLAGRPYHSDALINHKTPEILISLGCDVVTEDGVAEHNVLLSDLQICSQWSYPNRLYAAAEFVATQPNNVQFVHLNSFGCGPDAIVIDECKEILESNGKSYTIIRVDEITATGSVRLRLRSVVESLNLNRDKVLSKTYRPTTAVFEIEDKERRTILAPHLSDIYSPLFPVIFELAGYKLENLPKPDKQSVELGLKYCNNEICYPATIVVGDIIKALQLGKYDRTKVAVGMTQTGGQCRASSYLSLIKKAMISAGFADVPIISLNSGNIKNNPQPGFKINWIKVLPSAFISILFADSIAKMYYSTAPRETNTGESLRIRDYYIGRLNGLLLGKWGFKGIYALLDEAVKRFNSIACNERYCPRIGVVGEIYVKYNGFGHQDTVDWLLAQKIEPLIPPILEFFMQSFVNTNTNIENHIEKRGFMNILMFFLEKLGNRYIHKTNAILSKFRYYQPFHSIRHMAEKAEQILTLTNQFGEGWLIPAGIAAFVESGVNNVISLQPFGCIANHVVSKGVEKRMKDIYTKLNLLYLDFDDGAGEVNILNRLHFMVSILKNEKAIIASDI
ncbi:MAG: acyl-CoA dehydratase activase-related protein [Prevotellaceae bacterium]|nr:acyl-CoA dehydratase activase-related protein [Prevotellaceae bacterium]